MAERGRGCPSYVRRTSDRLETSGRSPTPANQLPDLLADQLPALRAESDGSRRKRCGAGRRTSRKTRRRPATGRAGLNGGAPRSPDGKPKPCFSGLRSGFRGEPSDSAPRG
jgi:hypothetical protein